MITNSINAFLFTAGVKTVLIVIIAVYKNNLFIFLGKINVLIKSPVIRFFII